MNAQDDLGLRCLHMLENTVSHTRGLYRIGRCAKYSIKVIQSTTHGSNIVGTMEICSGHGLFEPLRVNHGAGQEANGDNLEKSFRSSIPKWYVECTH